MRFPPRTQAERQRTSFAVAPAGFGTRVWLAVATAILCGSLGCDKVPTFQEIISQDEGGETEAAETPEAPPAPVQRPKAPEPKVQAPPSPEEIWARVEEKESKGFKDLDLQFLAENLSEHPDLVTALNMTGSRGVTDDGVQKLAPFHALVELRLNGTSVTNASLDVLENMPNLEILGLNGTRITVDVLPKIGHLTKLRVLEVAGTNLEGPEFAELLGRLKNLRSVHISFSNISATPFVLAAKRGGLSEIRQIYARQSRFGIGLADLRALPTLEYLDVNASSVTDVSLEGLRACRNLRILILSNNSITDEGLGYLQRCHELRRVDLSYNDRLRGAGLEAFVRCKQMEKLEISDTKVGQRYINALKERIPGLVVYKDGQTI